jgi:hypothetical protein
MIVMAGISLKCAGRREIGRPRKKWKEVQLVLNRDYGRILIGAESGKEQNKYRLR